MVEHARQRRVERLHSFMWWHEIKKPEWIIAIGTIILVVLTLAILLLTVLSVPDGKWPILNFYRWPFSLVPIVVVAGIVLAAILNFTAAKLKASTTQVREQANRKISIGRLNLFITEGHSLLEEIPKSEATASDFVRFWRGHTAGWSKKVARTLSESWGKEIEQDFFSVTGMDTEQPLARIHPEARTDYRYLSRGLQNLERIRQAIRLND